MDTPEASSPRPTFPSLSGVGSTTPRRTRASSARLVSASSGSGTASAASPELPAWLVDAPFAHRGRVGPDAPENSLAALAAAVGSGCGVELDVRLGGDDVVVFHDVTALRMCGVDEDVLHLSPRRLRALRLAGTGEGVPTLAAALDVVGPAPVVVELKPVPDPLLRRELVSRVARTLTRHRTAGGNVGVHSFDLRVLRLLAVHAPHLPRGHAAGDEDATPLQRLAQDGYLSAPVTRPSFIAHNVLRLPAPRVTNLRNWGVPTLAWTARSPGDLEAVAFEVDNVIAEGAALDAVTAAGSFAQFRSGLVPPRRRRRRRA